MWLIEWVSGTHNSFKEGRDDGKTPRERAGWQNQSTVMELSEAVQFIPLRAESRADKFDAKLQEGVWLGLDNRTDENLNGTAYGCTDHRPSRESLRTSAGTLPEFSLSSGCPGILPRTSTQMMGLECPTQTLLKQTSSPKILSCRSR